MSATTALAYDDFGNLTSSDGPLSGSDDTVHFRYDADYRRIGAIAPDPDGGGARARLAQRTTYDDDDNITQIELGTVASTSDSDWAAFSSAQQHSSTYINGYKKRETLTASSTIYAVIDYSYDSAGRLDCVATRMNSAAFGTATAACTAQTAGAAGPDRIAKATSYDALNRVLEVTSAYGTSDATVDKISYTTNGKTATVTDGESNKTTYEYDGHDRLSKTRFPELTRGTTTSSTTDYEQLTHDAAGNVTNRRLRDGTNIGFSYDYLNRLTAKDVPNSAFWEKDLSYTYDLAGRLASVTESGSGGIVISLGYDALGRKTSESHNYYGTTTSAYNAAGQRTRLTWPDSFYADYDYNAAGEMTAIRENGASSGAGVLATYSYDNLGRRTGIARGNGTATSYSYDSVSRLASLSQDLSGSGYDFTHAFNYNPAGQIAGRNATNDAYAWSGAVNVSRSYTTNGLNQHTLAGGVSLGYDARGNLTSSGSDSFSYTSENRLASSGSVNLGYDPLGRLYFQNIPYKVLQYDGAALLIEKSASSGAILRRYVYGPDADEPVVWYEGSGTSDRRWLHADERGSVVAITNGSGAMINVNSYDEYGIPAAGNVGRFQYTGQAWLPELGIYYYKARIYSPTLGRFMQTDPIGYGDGLNLYGYVKNDPVNATDPRGTDIVVTGGRPRCTLEPESLITLCANDHSAVNSFNRSWANNFPYGDSGDLYNGFGGFGDLADISLQDTKQDYCGGSNWTSITPDSVDGVDVSSACKAHDECYGSSEPRAKCDDNFYYDIVDRCMIDSTDEKMGQCMITAWSYWRAVKTFGSTFYSGTGPNPIFYFRTFPKKW